jgi:DNA polymerase-3 subunit delta
VDAFSFLQRPPQKLQSVYVVHGEEEFLRREAIRALRTLAFGGAGDDFGLSSYSGDQARWADVHTELQTRPFLGPQRLIVIENADPFVSAARSSLEEYLDEPAGTGNILVLELKSFPSNTRLAKMWPASASISCKPPSAARLIEWCQAWAETRYQHIIASAAARLLVDLVGPEMGQLDQELAKLAVYARDEKTIEAIDVDRLVGRSRSENVFKIFDAISSGDPGLALAMLDQVLSQGDEPLRVLGAFSYQLRRLVKVFRLHEQNLSMREALEGAGVVPFAWRSTEALLRHLGRERINRLYMWLLEADQALKSSGQFSERLVLERLLVRMAAGKESESPRAAGASP